MTRALTRKGLDIIAAFEALPYPTVALIDGACMGGGLELALGCDFRLAGTHPKTEIGLPETKIGLFPGWGGTQRLARATTLAFAKELAFTGRAVGAEEALARGLVNAIHEPAELLPKALELAESLAGKGPLALAYAKEATNLALQGEHTANLETEARLFAMLFATEDQAEGMTAFGEKRPPRFTGR